MQALIFNTPQEEITYLQQVISDLNEELYEFRRPIFIHNRINKIIDILFPSYYYTTNPENKPPIYPTKNWWWNGATPDIDSLHYFDNSLGEEYISIGVKSYICVGSYDVTDAIFPASFIDLPEDDVQSTVTEWLLNEIKEHKEKQKAKKEKENLAKIASLNAELDLLKNG